MSNIDGKMRLSSTSSSSEEDGEMGLMSVPVAVFGDLTDGLSKEEQRGSHQLSLVNLHVRCISNTSVLAETFQ